MLELELELIEYRDSGLRERMGVSKVLELALLLNIMENGSDYRFQAFR